jgi:signal transduction histidine kinase
MASAPHPLARRIHDRVLQLLGSALLKTEMCEQLDRLGRGDEIPAQLGELREALEQTVVELRGIMADLRELDAAAAAAAAEDPDGLKNRAA